MQPEGYGGFAVYKYLKDKVENENITDDDILNEYEIKKIELQKEKYKLQDIKNEYNKAIRESARFETFLETIHNAVKESNLKEYKPIQKEEAQSAKELVSVWSDFHYGIGVNNEFGSFDKDIFCERFFKYIDKVIEIGKMHNVQRVVVLELGDTISGIIHPNLRLQGVENVVNQVQEVSEIMTQSLYKLAEQFSQIDVYIVSGNHGRVNANKDESLSQENFEKFIPWYLKSRLRGVKQVTIHDNKIDDIIQVDVCGNKIVGLHGENDKPNSIVYNIPLMLKYIPSTIFTGHYHHFFEDSIHGIDVIGSGSVVGTDSWAKDVRKTGYPCQTVCIFTKDGKECSYNIRLY
jgi:predicted phosphodiesterase